MKTSVAVFAGLLFSAVLFAQSVNDPHSKNGFMPQVENWMVEKSEPLISTPDREFLGGENILIRSEDGREGFLVVVEGVVIAKGGEVEKGHEHMAILMKGGGWVMGEPETMYITSSGISFSICIKDYFTEKENCGVVAHIEKTGEKTAVLKLDKSEE